MNQALYNFIKKCIGNASGSLDPGDKLFFFKNVDFKREKLQICKIEYHRVIKLENADAVIINTQQFLPQIGLYLLIDNSIQKDHPGDELLIADIVYNLDMWTSQDIIVVQQFYKMSQLPKLPKIIDSKNLVEFINSGLVINEDNLDEMEQMLQTNKAVAYSLLDSCDITKSIPFILYLIYLSADFSKSRDFVQNIPLILNYCRSKQITLHDNLSDKILDIINTVPFLKDRIMRRYVDIIKSRFLATAPQAIKDASTISNVVIEWN